MNHIQRIAAAAGLFLTVSAAAFAQAPGTPAQGQPGKHRAGGHHVLLAAIPVPVMAMFADLKDDQKTKIAGIEDKYHADAKALRQPGTPPSPDVRTKERGLAQQASDDIKAVLTKEQQDSLQAAVPMLAMLASSRAIPFHALPDLNLTQDQIGKLRALTEETQGKIQALPRDQRQAQRPAILADFRTKVDALLTPEQKALAAKPGVKHPRRDKGGNGTK